MRFRLTVLATLVLLGVALPVTAQSLADVARREQERRKTIKETPRTLTNKDLPEVGSAPPSTSSASSDAAGDKSDASADKDKDKDAKDGKDAAAKDKDAKDADADKPKDQKYWSDKMKALQTTLGRDQAFAEALQTRINSLSTDFVNRDDPAQRAAIADNKQKALDELARLTKAIDEDKKAIATLEEEARRASVPAGWLR